MPGAASGKTIGLMGLSAESFMAEDIKDVLQRRNTPMIQQRVQGLN